MSNDFINSRTQAYNQRNQDKTTLSLRLSIKEDLILQELADAWETTRQDIIHDLISEYIIKAWDNQRANDQNHHEKTDNSTATKYFFIKHQ